MTPKEIESIVFKYKKILSDAGLAPKKLNESRILANCTNSEIFSHALFLCEETLLFVKNPSKILKSNRHVTAIQICLGFTGKYSLEELMCHNSPS